MTSFFDSTARAYKWYALTLLMLLFAVNFLDRQVINILAESIKRDLLISDAQLGLLTGTAFGIFYSVLGLPIARLADRYSRVGIISISLFLWSVMTAACGFTTSYLQLFLVRLGVGVGEAGGTPPSQSLISDLFTRSRRSLAMSIFNVGLPLGSCLGFLLGAFVNKYWGWRAAFIVAGVPGLVLVVLIRSTLKEPVRGQIDGVPETAPAPLAAALRGLFAARSYSWLVSGSTFAAAIVYVTNAWLPSLFIRVHGMKASEVGGWIALSTGLGGAIGVFGGGILVQFLKPRFPQAESLVPIASTALTFPVLLFTVLTGGTGAALAGMFALYVLAYVWLGPSTAMIQRAAPIRARALANGIQLAVANIFALSLGPPLVGYLSDRLRPFRGNDSIRYSLAYVSVCALFAAASYYMAARQVSTNLNAGDIATP